ncbi:hypothetical protein [Flavobacterium sp.]|uniref:hypothetical protein n=1 Tax=Flavobacterium sp. TaxID=239 RepID=UPI003265A3B0
MYNFNSNQGSFGRFTTFQTQGVLYSPFNKSMVLLEIFALSNLYIEKRAFVVNSYCTGVVAAFVYIYYRWSAVIIYCPN